MVVIAHATTGGDWRRLIGFAPQFGGIGVGIFFAFRAIASQRPRR